MKIHKKIILLIMIIVCLLLSACARNVIGDDIGDDIVRTEIFDYKEIYCDPYYKIIVDRTTGVLYVNKCGERWAGLSPLYNADGSLKLYRGTQ